MIIEQEKPGRFTTLLSIAYSMRKIVNETFALNGSAIRWRMTAVGFVHCRCHPMKEKSLFPAGVPQDRLRSEDLSERWETGFSYLVLRTGIEPVSHIPEFLIRCIMQEDRQRECILCCIYLHKPLIFFNQHPDTGNPKSVILVIGFR